MSNQLVIFVESVEDFNQKVLSGEVINRNKIQFKCIECGCITSKIAAALKRRPIFDCTSCSRKKAAGYAHEIFLKNKKSTKKPEKVPHKNEFLSKDERKKLIREKREQTMLSRYGVRNCASLPKRALTPEEKEAKIEKIKQTKLKKYGHSGYCNPNKAKQTCLSRYGVSNIAKKFGFSRKLYSYNGEHFDSSWELAYYIYLKDNNVSFSYHPKIKFEYKFEEKSHFYFPDFIVENRIVEIKNDSLFARMQILNTQENEKFKCMQRNDVLILLKKDIEPYLEYVSKTYGKAFLKKCRNEKSAKS